MQKDVDAAYQAAVASPKDPEKVGELGKFYFVGDSAVAAAACFAKAAELDPGSIKWRYYLAVAYERTYQLPKAIDAYQQLLSVDNNFVPALLRLANILVEVSPERAEPLYKNALELLPDTAIAHYGLGLCSKKAGDARKAIDHYRRAVQLAPDYADAHKALSMALLEIGETVEAEAHRAKGEEGGPAPPVDDPLFDALVRQARSVAQPVQEAERLAMANRFDEAAALLEKYIQENPDDLEAEKSLAVVIGMKGDLTQAAERLRKLIEKDPGDLEARASLAKALIQQGQYAAAEKELDDLLKKDSTHPDGSRVYVLLLVISGRAEDAVQTAEKLLAKQPDNPANHLTMTIACVAGKKFDQAVGGYKSLRDLLPNDPTLIGSIIKELATIMARQKSFAAPDPAKFTPLQPQDFAALADRFKAAGMEDESRLVRDYLEFLVNQAVVTARQGGVDQALRLLTDLLPIDEKGMIETGLGIVHGFKGQADESVRHFRAALKANPDHVGAKTGLAETLTGLGQFEEAEKLLREVADKRPDDAAAVQRLGNLLAGRGKNDEAVKLLRRAVELQPGNPASLFYLGELLSRLGQHDEAISHLRECVKLSPENVNGRFILGVAYNRAGKTAAAKEEWRKVVQAAPAFADGYIALATAAMQEKDHAETQQVLQRGLRHAPESPQLANALAWSLATCSDALLRDGKEAVRWAEKAAKLAAGNSEVLDTLAAAYAEAGRFDDAVKAQQEAIDAATKAGQTGSLEGFKSRLDLYRTGKPYHEEK